LAARRLASTFAAVHRAFGAALLSCALGCGSVAPPLGPIEQGGPDPLAPGDGDRERPFTEEERAQSRGKLGGIWVNCYQSFLPEGDPTASLARLTSACGKSTGMAAVTPVRVGEPQAQQDAVERFTFHARANRCYRVYSVGAPEVAELDVAVLDPTGHLAASDASRDRWPVVPARGPLCTEREGAYTLEVAVAKGSGAYALQVWGD
jgi:hypothetical protein